MAKEHGSNIYVDTCRCQHIEFNELKQYYTFTPQSPTVCGVPAMYLTSTVFSSLSLKVQSASTGVISTLSFASPSKNQWTVQLGVTEEVLVWFEGVTQSDGQSHTYGLYGLPLSSSRAIVLEQNGCTQIEVLAEKMSSTSLCVSYTTTIVSSDNTCATVVAPASTGKWETEWNDVCVCVCANTW